MIRLVKSVAGWIVVTPLFIGLGITLCLTLPFLLLPIKYRRGLAVDASEKFKDVLDMFM